MVKNDERIRTGKKPYNYLCNSRARHTLVAEEIMWTWKENNKIN